MCVNFVINFVLMVVIPVALSSDAVSEECASGVLHSANDSTAQLDLTKGVTLKVLPEEQVKVLRIRLLLENTEGLQLYNLGMDADMGVQWGDVSVTMFDVKSKSNVCKVSWPPVLLPNVWTIMHIKLHYQHLLQLSVFPLEDHEIPLSSKAHPVTLTPLALSFRLERSGIAKLRLKLLTDTSLKYTTNCGKEYLATSFASEFGIASSVPFWRSWTWILLGFVILFLIIIALLLLKLFGYTKDCHPITYLKYHFQKKADQDPLPKSGDTLQTPSVSMGVVSSRAPSPGQYIDENTFDYINQAYTSD